MSFYTILIAEDDPLQRRSLRRMLEKEFPAAFIEVENGVEALNYLKGNGERPVSLAILDLHMPIMDGMVVLRQARGLTPRLPCLVLTGSERIEDAVEAMQLGAIDFITKPAQQERLITSVRNALALSNLQEEVARLQQDRQSVYHFDAIMETSPGLKETVLLARKVAGSDIPVLITGESGVGKEVFARALHLESARRNEAFVPVNCGAIPDNLVESTLFGHEKGSFTGAIARAIGKCREADHGTLFLDEVGELKPDAQVKLLRMLQQGEIEPVGSSKVIRVDVRVVSATNQPLEQRVAEGRFREDLFYRLQGLPLPLPPLRARPNDILPLARHLLYRIKQTERRTDLQLLPETEACLASYQWPGNVRELQHVLHRAVLLAEDKQIRPEDVSRWFQKGAMRASETSAGHVIKLDDASGKPKTLEQLEREIIEATLLRQEGHIGRTAIALGIGQSTLYKRMQKSPADEESLSDSSNGN